MLRILYRADGGHPVGTGHILRALRVAAYWAEIDPDVRVLLVSPDAPSVKQFVAAAGLPNVDVRYLEGIELGPVPRLEASTIAPIAKGYQPDVIVVDMLDTPDGEMRVLREMSPTLISLDDRGAGRVHSDLIINFLVRDPEPSQLDMHRTWLREGPEYASLSTEFVGITRGRREPDIARRLLVSMGGADAVGLVVKVVAGLSEIDDLREVDLAVGAAFQHGEKLREAISRVPWKVNVHTSLPSLLPLYRKADIAIVAGGITMHEAPCCGVPAIGICQPIDHQLLVAGWLEDAGCMLNMGYGEDLPPTRIADAVRSLAHDQSRRQSMSNSGLQVCDGRGSMRTAQAILDRAGLSRQSRQA